jgi:hypothetical protein
VADSVIIIDASGSGAPPEIRPPTPEEQAQLDADRAAAAARVVAVGARNVSHTIRTTDDVAAEILRFPTHSKHVYRATLRVCGIDAGNGTTRDSQVVMVFKGLASSLGQVGATAVLWNMQDTAAASWRIQPSVQGADLVVQVTGAVGRTIDWSLAGEVGAFAPEGLDVG